MKHRKRILSFQPALTMVICLFSIAPVTASAEDAVISPASDDGGRTG